MNELEKAEMLARWAHRDQTDLEGMPYWTHCKRVAGNLKAAGYDDVIQAIGWLHDVVEDTDVTEYDLIHLFNSDHDDDGYRICDGVWAMTQEPNEPLEKYWARVKANEDARIVKLFGDIPDNDDEQRGARLSAALGSTAKRDKQRAKYLRARKFLMTDEEWWSSYGYYERPLTFGWDEE